MQIQSKLPKQGTTIFTIMSQLALKHQAINLGQGFPDFAMSEQLTALVTEAMQKGFNQYTHMNGYPPLREKLANKVFNLYKNNINAEQEITICPGATYAIYTALCAILQKDDEVIFFEPAYDSYLPGILLNHAIPVPIELNAPSFSIPWDEVKNKITSKTKAIIINSPHNPSGAVLRQEDLSALKEICRDKNIFVISDEVYEHLIFENLQHHSLLSDPELYERSFVCFSFGKTYHCTGWKLGYVISPPDLSIEFRKIHQFNAFCSDTPKQVALAKYLENTEAYLQLGAEIQKKRDLFASLMNDTPFERIPSYGSYFECYRYLRQTHLSEYEFAEYLAINAGVVGIPVSAFYSNPKNQQLIRFCFAKKEETLIAATERLRNFHYEL